MTSETNGSTPQARRWARTDARLCEALRGLVDNPDAAPTVAALARAAGVGRNIIYTHHAGVLDALRDLQALRADTVETKADDRDRARTALREAEAQVIVLATQNAALLKRAVDAEHRADRLERRNAQLVRELDRLQRPIAIRAGAEAPNPSAA